MIYYKADLSSYQPKITKEEFVSETANFLVRGSGHYVAKTSQWAVYYSTWNGARDALVALWEQRVKQSRADLERQKSALGNVKGWEQP